MQAINSVTPYAHWLLRIVLASVFIYHGGLSAARSLNAATA